MAKFEAGSAWRGNKNGRPLKTYRERSTEEFFKLNKNRISNIGVKTLGQAEDGKPWAIKLVWETFFTKPRTEVPSDSPDDNTMEQAKSCLSKLPPDLLKQLKVALEDQRNSEASENLEEYQGPLIA